MQMLSATVLPESAVKASKAFSQPPIHTVIAVAPRGPESEGKSSLADILNTAGAAGLGSSGGVKCGGWSQVPAGAEVPGVPAWLCTVRDEFP